MDKSLAITLGCIIPIALAMTVLSIHVLIQIIKRNRRAFKVLLEKQEEDNIAVRIGLMYPHNSSRLCREALSSV